MASRGDIEAGKAHIVLYVKNSRLVKGLNAMQSQLQDFGKNIMAIGGMIAGVGAAIVAPLAGALAHFMEVGGSLADMSARTGVAVGALAELGFAATQTGSSAEDVEKGIAKMQRTLAEAAKGEKTATDALTTLGLTAKDLEGKLPDEQLAMVGERLTAIQDPAKKTAATMEVLGKSGTKLLPMLANLAELRAEAQALGLAPTQQAVDDADALGDAWDSLQDVIKATVFEVGAALAPALIPVAKAVVNIAAGINRWVRENGSLIRTVAAAGAGLMAIGGIVTAVGATIFGLGTMFGMIASGLTTVATLIAGVFSPAVLLVAAIAGGVYAWARFTASGRATIQTLVGGFQRLLAIGKDVVSGIGDALLTGDLELAGRIAWTGLKLVFAEGLAWIAGLMGGTLGDTVGAIGTKVLKGDLQNAWETTVIAMGKLWADFAEGVVAVFTLAARGVTDVWQSTVGQISDAMLSLAAGDGITSQLFRSATGIGDVGAEQARAEKAQRDQIAVKQRLQGQFTRNRDEAMAAGDTAAAQAWQKQLDDITAQIALLKGSTVDVLAEAQQAARDQVAGVADSTREWLDGLDKAMQAQSDAIGAELADDIGGGASKASGAAAGLADELAKLRAQAAAARDAARKRDEDAALATEPEAMAGLKSAASATFSAAGAMALGFGGGGGGPVKQIAKGIEKLVVQGEVLHKDNITLGEKIVRLVPTAQ